MAKKSQRRIMRYERDQSGCMWSLISILDFRHGRSTRRLLSDRRRGSRNTVDAGNPINNLEASTHFNQSCQGTHEGEEGTAAIADAGKPSVKKLIEEEMISEQDPMKEISNAEVEQKQLDNEDHLRKHRRRTRKTSKESCDMHTHDLNAAGNVKSEFSSTRNSRQHSTGSLDIDAIMEDFCSQINQRSIGCVKHGQQGEVLAQSNQKHSNFEEKLSAAIKAVIDRRFITGNHLTENEKIENSEELRDAFQILSSDEELFLKLLQDPNSLLVKHVENLQGSQVNKGEKSRSNLSDQELGNLRQSEELVNPKQRNFFRRKVKSREINSSKNENSQASDTIVILKPGQARLQKSGRESSLGKSPEPCDIFIDKGSSEKVGSHFFLTEIKRRLKHAMGKEQHGTSPNAISERFPSLGDNAKGVGGENVGRNSPNKDHFYIEKVVRPVKRGDKIGKLKDCEIRTEIETAAYPNQRVSNIYTEAKKHLSEMLSNGNGDVDSSSRQVPKTLGRILSLPEYNFSPIDSPGRDLEQNFVTAQMRFSAYDKFRQFNENTWSPKKENNASHLSRELKILDTQSVICDDDPGRQVEETSCSFKVEMNSEVDVEIAKGIDTVVQEESNALVAPSESINSSIAGDDQNDATSEVCDEKQHSEHLKQNSNEETHSPSFLLTSPSSSSLAKKAEDLERTIDIAERPSPVSVLEPLFTEDDVSPASTRSPSVELPVKPLRIQFEEHESSPTDQGIHFKNCTEDKDSAFEYVKAVLQASGLNWDEFNVKLLSSDQLLDPLLFDEIEFSNQLCCDQKLLFDCINEVLLEICYQYFGCSPLVSFAKPGIRPVPNMKNSIREVWEGVYWHLLPQPLPHTLEQIVRKDMAKSGTWMDLRFDTESIGLSMGEAILEELMEDTILSSVDDSSENGYTVFAELKEDESSIYL